MEEVSFSILFFFFFFLIATKIPCSWGERAVSFMSDTYFGIFCRAVACTCSCRLIQSHLYCISYSEMLLFLISLSFLSLPVFLIYFPFQIPILKNFWEKASKEACVILVGIYLAHHSLTCSWEEIVLPGPSTDSMREHFHRIETEAYLWKIKPTLDLFMSWMG